MRPSQVSRSRSRRHALRGGARDHEDEDEVQDPRHLPQDDVEFQARLTRFQADRHS
jgi:hypothetical protein